MNNRYRSLIALLVSTALVLALPGMAMATPTSEKQAEAAKVKAQVEELDAKVEIASDDYHEADSAYQAVTKKVKAAEEELAELTANQEKLQSHLDTRVESMYRSGPLGPLELLFGATTFEEFASTWDLLQLMNENDAGAVAELKQTRAEIAAVKVELKAQQAEAKDQLAIMTDRKTAIEEQLAERKRVLAGLESEVAALQAAEEAKRVASIPKGDYGDPTNAPRSEVVSIAKSKLGSRYVWGAAGPNTFDCSGFTMWVYARVGVSLPHSSRAQIGYGQRVSRANLAAGDLVFFGTSVIHHVGIYVGGGMYIHAPHTGDVVKISSLDRSDYAGACRP
ncbi:MAG: C40 family peptidase [Coriobacteriia bacterium]|nr:C40 family peptidase [Coriobacteriia bacterium]MBN2822021.1 C40 family peptidase [Coriobacteriia bacterium]